MILFCKGSQAESEGQKPTLIQRYSRACYDIVILVYTAILVIAGVGTSLSFFVIIIIIIFDNLLFLSFLSISTFVTWEMLFIRLVLMSSVHPLFALLILS